MKRGPNPIYEQDYLGRQFLRAPDRMLPIVAAEADGKASQPLQSLLIHLRWERKKTRTPLSEAQKLARLPVAYAEAMRKGGLCALFDTRPGGTPARTGRTRSCPPESLVTFDLQSGPEFRAPPQIISVSLKRPAVGDAPVWLQVRAGVVV